MIELIAPAQTPQAESGRKPARDDLAAGFSFAAAMQALEGRAAQSLETFGAAPQGSGASTAKASAPAQDGENAPQAQKQAQQDNRPAEPNAATTNALETQAAPKTGLVQQVSPAVLQTQAPQLVAAANAALPLQPVTVAAKTEASAMRASEPVRMEAPKATRAAAPAPSQPATHDFAKLLARRLDNGATSFELRLDPPELGRVEAHLKTGDDGKAVLALKFENQTTLDMFARDEAGLRAALMSSGFDLGGERLAFILADETQAAEMNAPAFTVIDTAYEPQCRAAYSNGAVDLRV